MGCTKKLGGIVARGAEHLLRFGPTLGCSRRHLGKKAVLLLCDSFLLFLARKNGTEVRHFPIHRIHPSREPLHRTGGCLVLTAKRIRKHHENAAIDTEQTGFRDLIHRFRPIVG